MTHRVMHHRTPTLGRGLALALGVLLMATPLVANDWPEWRGAGRNGVWTETGIVDELPAELKVKWRVPINGGFSGPANPLSMEKFIPEVGKNRIKQDKTG